MIFTNVFSNNHYKIIFNIYKKYNTKELIDWVNLLSNFLMDHRNRIRYTILEISIIFGLQFHYIKAAKLKLFKRCHMSKKIENQPICHVILNWAWKTNLCSPLLLNFGVHLHHSQHSILTAHYYSDTKALTHYYSYTKGCKT